MLALALLCGALLTGYNIAHEMVSRKVPLEHTNIVDSIRRRTPGESYAYEPLPLADFAPIVGYRLAHWFFPVDHERSRLADPESDHTARYLVILAALALALGHAARQPASRRIPLLLTAGSGLAWTFGMVNYTRFHDFATMHALGFALVFWLAALAWLRRRPRLTGLALALALTLFARSALLVEAENRADFAATARYTEEFESIRRQLGEGRRTVGISDGALDLTLSFFPFAPSFYLQGHTLTEDWKDAEFLVANREALALPPRLPADDREGLRLLYTRTPQHEFVHLFAIADAERRTLPPDLATRQNFAGQLALGAWNVDELKPCERIRLETWWQALRPPGTKYWLNVAITDAAGQTLAASDAPLSTENTMDWLPQDWYLEVRSLQVPCDLPPGEYSLLLNLHSLWWVERGELELVDAAGNWSEETRLLLTSLLIEPPGLAARHNFAGELALGAWNVDELKPCERIRLETWWQALRPTRTKYWLRVALTDAAGQTLALSDEPLTRRNTMDWLPERWVPDARILQVPCDLPPGEYSLLLNLHSLWWPERGELELVVDDAGNWGEETRLLLTSLLIEPPGLAARHNFAGELALGAWNVDELKPCERIRLETWWQALRPTKTKYWLRVALTDAAGQTLALSDEPLTIRNTMDWLPGRWVPDARSLQLPCDLPPGEYSLLLNLHSHWWPERGELELVDDAGNWGEETRLLLTSLLIIEPPGLAARHNFAGELALGAWNVDELKLCERIRLETWWQALRPTRTKYWLRVALTDAAGQTLALSDEPLTSRNTMDWLLERWVPDARILQLPCDLPPGEYSLLLNLHSHWWPERGELELVDAAGNWGEETRLLLTSLRID